MRRFTASIDTPDGPTPAVAAASCATADLAAPPGDAVGGDGFGVVDIDRPGVVETLDGPVAFRPVGVMPVGVTPVGWSAGSRIVVPIGAGRDDERVPRAGATVDVTPTIAGPASERGLAGAARAHPLNVAPPTATAARARTVRVAVARTD